MWDGSLPMPLAACGLAPKRHAVRPAPAPRSDSREVCPARSWAVLLGTRSEEEQVVHSRKPELGGPLPVTIGIDPHRGSHTAAALNPERQVLAEVRVPATRTGYRQLRAWADGWPRRRWAVEGASGN